MREITKTVLQFLVGFLLVLLLSAFLAPWLYTFLPFKFDRILRRCIMIGTLLLVARLLWARRKETWGRFGLEWNSEKLRFLGAGFLYGVAIVAAMTLIQLGLGARMWRLHETDLGHWIGLFFQGLGAGVLIGAIEELFFRGFLFLTLKDLWNTKASLVVTNFIYAVTHFFPKGKVFVGPEPTFADSFRIYSHFAGSPWESPEKILGVIGLFLFGLTLSFLYLKSNTLYPSIGTHAGAVFGLKLNRRFVPEIAEKMNGWTGSKNLYDGIAGLIVLAAAAWLVSRRPQLGGKS